MENVASLGFEFWMKEAIKLAQEAARIDEVPVGALLVRRGEILGRGYNHRETLNRTTAHAEILALEDFNEFYHSWRLPPETYLVSTVEPCLMCTGALLNARLEGVVYGCRDPRNAGLEKVRPFIQDGAFDHRFKEVIGGMLEAETSGLITGYFRQKRQERS